MGLIKPKRLRPGQKIGIFASSSVIDPQLLDSAAQSLRDKGFEVFVHPQSYVVDHGAAGTTAEKISAFHDLLRDASVDAIMSARGGARALHLLDRIDWELWRSNPKILLGFSDVTALLSAGCMAGMVTFHGTVVAGFHPDRPQFSPEKTLEFLQGDWQGPQWSASCPTETLRAGEATGDLYGGNLALLYGLAAAGHDYFPDLTGKILVIEDIGEEMRAIDRMLGAFRLRGIFQQIAGLIVGQMTDIRDTSGHPFGRSIRQIVAEHTEGTNFPIVLDAPIGHEQPNLPFALGVKARLTAPETGHPQLELLESPFRDEV